MPAKIGIMRVTLSADSAKFEQGMKRAQVSARTTGASISKSLGGMSSSVKAGLLGLATGLTVGLAAALTSAVKGALDYAGALGETAQQLGVTTRDLQVFRFAAGQTGVSQQQLETGLSKLTITLGKVAAGAREPARALAAIGISADQLRGKNTGEAFRIIADGLQKVTDRSQRAAIEVALFGKSGAMLDNLLSGGSGAINELASAADRLGIVLSDEQIQKADETADKLNALKTVLSARIAGIVADNTDSILTLAGALSTLVGWLATAIRSYKAFAAVMDAGEARLKGDRVGVAAAAARLRDLQRQEAGGSSAENRTARFRRGLGIGGPAVVPDGADIGEFLAPRGGGGRKKTDRSAEEAERKRLEALRDAFQFDQELRRAQMDVLRATQDLAVDYVERNTIAVQILDAERAAYAAELEYEVKAKEKTKAQAAQLLALYDSKDALERQKIVDEEQAQAAEDSARLDDLTFELNRDKLQSEQQLATTAAEQRDVQMRLLKLFYEQERARLEAILADKQSTAAAKEEARRRLAGLSETEAMETEAVRRGTRGPLEEWAASIPQTAAQINEAFESIQAQGLDGLSDAIADVITGTKSLKSAFSDLAQSIISDLIRMSIRMLIFRALSGVLGGSLGSIGGGIGYGGGISEGGAIGMASGGSIRVRGRGGTDRNVLSINGLPVARVSANERIDVSNDNNGGGGGVGHVVVELRDPLLDARIAEGANVQIMRTYPVMRADTLNTMRDRNRRR